MSIEDYDSLYQDAAKQYGLDPNLLKAQALIESNANPKAVNPETDAEGIAQIIPETAKALGVKDPSDPKQAIPAQAKLMAENMKRYKDPETALLAYHGGTDQDNWGPKTKAYASKVMDKYQQMAQNTNTQQPMDPIEAALSEQADEKNLDAPASPSTMDPIEAALSDQTDEHPETTIAHSKQADDTKPLIPQDILQSSPTAVVRGVGAVPQILPYLGNLAAQTEAFLYKKTHNLLSSTPVTPAQENALNQIQPFTTGDNLPDQLVKTAAQITQGVNGNSLTVPQNQALTNLRETGLSGNQLYEPQTLPGKLVSAGIEGALSGKLPKGVGPGMVQNALSGVGAQAMSHEYPNNPVATIAGGLVAPLAKGSISYMTGRASPETAQIAQEAQNHGINVPPGLMTDAPMNRLYSLLNRFGMTKNNTPEEFTGAVANELLDLPNTNRLTNSAMADSKKEIGKMYGQVADLTDKSGGTKITDPTLDKIQELRENAVEASPYIDKFFNKLTTSLDEHDTLTGDAYKKLTQTGSVLDNMQSSTKPEVKQAGQLLEKLLQNDLADSAGPDAKNILKQADKKYALWHMVNDSRDDTSGLVSPAKFSSEAWKRNADYFKSEKNLRSPSETYKLANIADQLKLTPTSGTAEHLLLERAMGLAGSGVAGYMAGGGLGGISGTLGAYGVGKGLGAALSSDWYRNYLIKNAISGNTPPPNALIRYGLPATAVVAGHQ
jgi:hypothetical protein